MSAIHHGGHIHRTERWLHGHSFLGASHERNERRTWLVIALTSAMMMAEIVTGWLFNSMALLADGWHMATHAGALAIAGFAYSYARRHARDARFAFGTGKLGDLAAFTSALILGMIAMLIAFEAARRLFQPSAIAFAEAIPIAVVGLAVNLTSAWLLGPDHEHAGHEHADHDQDGHDHDHSHGHEHDNNMRSAYIHVLADAATSVLAIIGLLAGLLLGWVWLDPVMGLIGAAVIANWSYTLIRAAGGVLLDLTPDESLADSIRATLETDGDRLTDLHLWRIGPGHCGAIVALITAAPQAPAHYKARLGHLEGLSHVTIEVQSCEDACLGGAAL